MLRKATYTWRKIVLLSLTLVVIIYCSQMYGIFLMSTFVREERRLSMWHFNDHHTKSPQKDMLQSEFRCPHSQTRRLWCRVWIITTQKMCCGSWCPHSQTRRQWCRVWKSPKERNNTNFWCLSTPLRLHTTQYHAQEIIFFTAQYPCKNHRPNITSSIISWTKKHNLPEAQYHIPILIICAIIWSMSDSVWKNQDPP